MTARDQARVSRVERSLADAVRTRPTAASRVPVLAALVADLIAQGLKPPAIARRLNLTDSYVAKLHRITRGVPPEILLDWRTTRRPLSVTAMLSVAASPDMSARYRELQASWPDRRGTKAMLDRAREYGRMFARLDALGFGAPMPPYDGCIGHMFPRLDPKYWEEAATEVAHGWDEGQADSDDEYGDAETE